MVRWLRSDDACAVTSLVGERALNRVKIRSDRAWLSKFLPSGAIYCSSSQKAKVNLLKYNNLTLALLLLSEALHYAMRFTKKDQTMPAALRTISYQALLNAEQAHMPAVRLCSTQGKPS